MTAATTDGDRLIGLSEAGKRIGLSRWTIRQRICSLDFIPTPASC